MAKEEIRLTQLGPNPEERPSFTTEQLSDYFSRINLPPHISKTALQQLHDTSKPHPHRRAETALSILQALIKHHISSIPVENLILHYSSDKTVTLDPLDLHIKFVTHGATYGRGGRCMENNSFFAIILRSLGFSVRTCAGRVSRQMHPNASTRKNQSQTYDGWNHMLCLVRLSGEWYVVDVGMGAMGPNLAYPLRDGYEQVSVAPRRLRIQYRAIAETNAESEDEAPKLWCFDVCRQPKGNGEQEEWLSTYCFTDMEFLPQDYEVMSWYTSTSPRMFFTSLMMVTKLLMDDKSGDLIGDITMVNATVTKTIAGQREVVAEFKTEVERLQGLEKYFNIKLTSEQAASLQAPLRLV